MRKNLIQFLFFTFIFLVYLTPAFSQDNIKNEMLKEVNKLRKSGCKCGNEKMPPAPALTWNDRLTLSASRHAKDMMKNNLTGHIGSNGTEPADRITAAGYQWIACGENVAVGYDSVKEVVAGWISSPGHCRNMMDPEFREIGAVRIGNYWVQNFGAR